MDISGRSFLVVDDVRVTRMILMRILKELGAASVREAEDGAVALRVLEELESPVDCVISDLDMPNVNGLELLQAIRGGTGRIPRDLLVVFLTGHSELEHLGPALLLDLDAFLAKPLSQKALQSCLDGLFSPQYLDGRKCAEAAFYRSVDLAPATLETVAVTTADDEAAGRAVPLEGVPVDSVLARDLLYANGRLLLRAGTRLSAQVLARLRDMSELAGLAETVWITGS